MTTYDSDRNMPAPVRGKHWLVDLLALLLALLIFLILIMISAQIGAVAHHTDQLRKQINDCTAVDGTCYKSQHENADLERTRQARVAIAIDRCNRLANINSSVTDIESCVTKEMEDFGAPPKPLPGG